VVSVLDFFFDKYACCWRTSLVASQVAQFRAMTHFGGSRPGWMDGSFCFLYSSFAFGPETVSEGRDAPTAAFVGGAAGGDGILPRILQRVGAGGGSRR